MNVEIWSDIVCPWCYIGKRRFEAALDRFEHRDEVQITWRSFELDPSAPPLHTTNAADRLAHKYGTSREQALASQARLTQVASDEGLDFRFDRARSGNTLDAHQLLHLATEHGLQGQAKERLLRAYFTEGEPIGDPDTLVRLVAEVGVPAADARRVLETHAFETAVRADEQEARALGISGVPFFVLDRRYGISGAQPAEAIAEALEATWREAHPLQLLTTAGGSPPACEGDSCAV